MRKKGIVSAIFILIAVILIGGGFYYQSNKGGRTPDDAAQQFLINLTQENYKTARKYLANETKKMYDNDRFEVFKKTFWKDGRQTSTNPGSISFQNGGKSAVGNFLTIGGDEGIASTQVTFIKTAFGWKIENIKTGF
ncbi:hypothetical protein ACE3MQ_19770 [Paenibacillus lentus]|uniref:hypothetical protein n=1 Tax=Paenibacillus lentus TaxID=1338368 RepID=UPI00365B1713